MNDDQDPDRDLRVALARAAESVEPGDRLVAIRQQTRRQARRRRSWWAGGGAVLVAASVVTVALVAGSASPQRAADPATPPTAEPTINEPTPVEEDPRSVLPVYYLGAGPDGPEAPSAALYRSFEPVGADDDVLDLLMGDPSDPDYRTLWPAGSLMSVSEPEAGVVRIRLDGDQALRDRPAEMSERQAELTVQAAVYTLQAVLQEPVAVQFVVGENPVDQVFGVPTSEPLARAEDLDVLSHMSIDDPAEGSTAVGGESFSATGRGNSFEATGSCSLLSRDGEIVVGPLIAQMDGYLEPRLFPWELTVDLDGVPPGAYTFACRTDDPTGGADGRGTDTDTRTVIVE